MPVPVPRFSKPPSHPVIKSKQRPSNLPDLEALSSSLPPCPSGPPPSFGTREEWIKSLPAWRRDKPRRIWEENSHSLHNSSEQGFPQGLTAAGNAPVIKGVHAEACLPPLYSLFSQFTPDDEVLDEDDDMGSDSSMDHSHLDNQSQWTASSPARDFDDIMVSTNPRQSDTHHLGSSPEHDYLPEGSAFSPVYEDQSPEEPVSSPLGPVTPFGIFVDRAVADAQVYPICGGTCSTDIGAQSSAKSPTVFAPFSVNTFGDVPKEPVPVADNVSSSVNHGYKKLAEPLANWITEYVWKVCTTGLSLPPPFVAHSYPSVQHAASPPPYLAVSVHSLLLSTLLQPSAVFLAIWYIIRLPVQFGSVTLGPEYAKEAAFRTALLGDPVWGSDRGGMEANAPFRLIVLGFMLANKWLDDHTFSNKTWHSISNVPTNILNKLEALTLDVFAYDLSVPAGEWSQWLTHILSYHTSLSSPGHPQPISRPGSSPHAIIRKIIEEVAEASANPSLTADLPEPVFIGLEERRREKIEKELQASEVLEIDLDEDGPLREEYVPRRRSTRNSQTTGVSTTNQVVENAWNRSTQTAKCLPPPAKWSPAGDEPILRERNRPSSHYVAVQAPHIVPYPVPYLPSHDLAYNTGWNLAVYGPAKPQHSYVHNFPPVHQVSQSLYPYPYPPSVPALHARSQSLSYNQENYQMRNHARSYSQSIFEYHCSDVCLTTNEQMHTEPGQYWSNGYAYSAPPPFGPIPAFQTTWLHT